MYVYSYFITPRQVIVIVKDATFEGNVRSVDDHKVSSR